MRYIFFLKEFVDTRKFISLILVILSFLITSIIFIDFLNIVSLQRIIQTNYSLSLEIIKNFILFLELPKGTFRYFSLVTMVQIIVMVKNNS